MTATATKLQASPVKLRSGDWGAKAQGEARQGDTVHITTKGGKEWDARVVKVVWTGDGVSIVATESLDRPHGREARGLCDNCYESAAKYSARDMSGLGGRVCGRCYGDGMLSFA